MKIFVNGLARDFPDHSLTVTEMITALDLGSQPVLVELNGETILSREFDEKSVSDGDVVEIIRMVAGG